jgi:hypothetical protein
MRQTHERAQNRARAFPTRREKIGAAAPHDDVVVENGITAVRQTDNSIFFFFLLMYMFVICTSHTFILSVFGMEIRSMFFLCVSVYLFAIE